MSVPLLPPFAASAQHSVDDFTGRVVCMDALDLLRMLPDSSVDMVLADLPYGVTACAWDTVIPIEPMWAELKRIVKQRAAIVLTATQPFTSRLVSSNYEMFHQELIWDKVLATGFLDANRKHMPRHESILIFCETSPNYYPQMELGEPYKKGQGSQQPEVYSGFNRNVTINMGLRYPKSIIGFSNASKANPFHPTQKPVALFEYLIRTYTVENDIVLDMTCGSGTTAIAARKTGRRFICGDLSPEYVQLAQTRLQNTDPMQATQLPNGMKQLSLFEGIA